MREEPLWTEKYRPKTISECVLPVRIEKSFQEFVDNKLIPNLLLHGSSGVGKTTVAKALCEQVCGENSIIINASEESGIEVLRDKVKGFTVTGSLYPGRKNQPACQSKIDVSLVSNKLRLMLPRTHTMLNAQTARVNLEPP